MPVSKTIGTVTLGDFGRGTCSSSDPHVRLFISDRPTHDLTGSATQVAYTNEVPLPVTPRRLVWTFEWVSGGGSLVLQEGHTYNFELSLSGCSSFKQTTWAPADPRLETPAATCISGLPFQTATSGPRRQWHDASTTPDSACVNYPLDWAEDWWPYEPDGWLVSINPGAAWYIAAVQNITGGNPGESCEGTWTDQGITQVNVIAPTGWEGDPIHGYHKVSQTDGICTWDHYHPPGETTDYGWSTALPLRSEFDAAPRLPYVGLGVTPEIAFRPILLFDKGEKWRPLSIDTFLNEHNPGDGAPVQCVGPDRDDCTPIEGMATLRQHYAPGDRIMEGDYYTSQEPLSPGGYRTQSTTCQLNPSGAAYESQECDDGPAAKIYYNALTRSAGYSYYDYWFFYRYNEFTLDNHESDWEHVTVAQSLTDPATFDWVNFYQHAYSNWSSAYHPLDGLYLREELTCDNGGSLSCGATNTPSGSRVWVYVAGGTHASYPKDCDGPCTQPGPATLEGDHGGQAPWSMNDTTGALMPFPAPNGWGFPGSGNWTDWPGKWGEQGIPASPANQPSFACPWNGNPDDATACTSRQRKTTAHAAATRAAAKCAGWYGDSVAAAACAPSQLKSAVHKGRVGHSGSIVLIPPDGRRASAGAGIAQAVRRLLAPGDRIRIRGARAQDTEIMVRARFGKTVKRWVLRDLGINGRPLTVTVPSHSTGRPKVTTD